MKRKLLSITLIFTLCFGLMIPATVASASYEDWSYLEWEGGEIYISKYNGSAATVTVPAEIDGKPVGLIGQEAFANCTSVISVSIPDSVWSVGDLAFFGCSNLNEIIVDPSSVYYTGKDGVLYNKNMTTLHVYPQGKKGDFAVPNGITLILSDAFNGCSSLTGITFPDSLKSIDMTAFVGCTSLTSINIPKNVTSIGFAAFANCNSLYDIYFESATPPEAMEAFFGLKEGARAIVPKGATAYGSEGSLWNELVVVYADAEPTQPPPPPPAKPQTLNPTRTTVIVNGEEKAFEAYMVSGSNYLKLRDLAFVLTGTEKQFEVGYDSATRAVTITTGEAYTPNGRELALGDGRAKSAVPTPSTIYLDGEELDFVVYNIGGSNFFKLRDLMQALDVYVGYDSATRSATLDTSRGYEVG